MTKKEISNKIKDLLLKEFEAETVNITPKSNLQEVFNLSSLDYVDLAIQIEDNFGFIIGEHDFSNIKTFQDLYDYCFDKIAPSTNHQTL
jgi:acyl carrier protein